MIEFSNVRKEYGKVVVVKDLNFKVDKGETLSIIGTSGSGKTTTLKMINRLIEPSDGKIFIRGKQNTETDLVELRRSMGYVLQGAGLFPHMTVEQNIQVPLRLSGINDRVTLNSRVGELLDLVRLTGFAKRFPKELSGGQQQRVGIARALANKTDLLLMDEPFGALDPITKAEIIEEFRDIKTKTGITVVMVTHDMGDALQLSHRILCLDNGVLQQFGTPAELRAKPANAFVKKLLKPVELMS